MLELLRHFARDVLRFSNESPEASGGCTSKGERGDPFRKVRASDGDTLLGDMRRWLWSSCPFARERGGDLKSSFF
jgi:hypothetical protein